MSEDWPDVVTEIEDAPQSAMLLTQQEWNDLAEMLTAWFDWNSFVRSPTVRRQRALAERIIEAAS